MIIYLGLISQRKKKNSKSKSMNKSCQSANLMTPDEIELTMQALMIPLTSPVPRLNNPSFLNDLTCLDSFGTTQNVNSAGIGGLDSNGFDDTFSFFSGDDSLSPLSPLSYEEYDALSMGVELDSDGSHDPSNSMLP